jgi:hypothetical protein
MKILMKYEVLTRFTLLMVVLAVKIANTTNRSRTWTILEEV